MFHPIVHAYEVLAFSENSCQHLNAERLPIIVDHRNNTRMACTDFA
jgi:hypothetical protein